MVVIVINEIDPSQVGLRAGFVVVLESQNATQEKKNVSKRR